MYKNIQKKPNEILVEIKKLIGDYNSIKGTVKNRSPSSIEEAKTSQESYYYWIRQKYNKLNDEKQKTIKGTAMFLFLNYMIQNNLEM